MSWSSEWKTSPVWPEKVDHEWQEHLVVNGGINPVALGVDYGYENKTLTIPIDGEWIPRTVEAIVIGDLAVHEDLKVDKFWQVTHVPTLTRFNAYREGLYKRSELIAWCRKVQEQRLVDWVILRSLTPKNYKTSDTVALMAKDRILRMCEGIEI